jgi:hypothetical protein
LPYSSWELGFSRSGVLRAKRVEVLGRTLGDPLEDEDED